MARPMSASHLVALLDALPGNTAVWVRGRSGAAFPLGWIAVKRTGDDAVVTIGPVTDSEEESDIPD